MVILERLLRFMSLMSFFKKVETLPNLSSQVMLSVSAISTFFAKPASR